MENLLCGKRIKESMNNKGWNQSDLYEHLLPVLQRRNITLSRASLSYYMSGKRLPRHDVITCLAEVLDVDVTWLWGLNESVEEERENIQAEKKVVVLPNPDNLRKAFKMKSIEEEAEETTTAIMLALTIMKLPKEKQEIILNMINSWGE